jgi:hypothetical protein
MTNTESAAQILANIDARNRRMQIFIIVSLVISVACLAVLVAGGLMGL